MNPFTYIKAFAWIALIALACSIFADFWIPMVVGALIVAVVASILIPGR